MKLKLILLLSLIAIVMVGCSKEDDDLVSQGKVALEKHEYEKARDLLADALQADSADDEARAMYMQAVKMEKANEYENQGNYKKAIKELERIEDIKDGSSSIKNEALTKKKELIKLDEEYQKAQKERKENAKEASKKGVIYAQKQVSSIQAKILAKEEENRRKEAEEKQKEEQNSQENMEITQPIVPNQPVTPPITPSPNPDTQPIPQTIEQKIVTIVDKILK